MLIAKSGQRSLNMETTFEMELNYWILAGR